MIEPAKLKQLIEQWRETAWQARRQSNTYHPESSFAIKETFNRCAGELEEAMGETPQ